MGLMAVALDLLLRIHPMSNGQEELKEMSSSRQDLKNDMQELEAAGFLKPCKETPDSWDFAQVHPRHLSIVEVPDTNPQALLTGHLPYGVGIPFLNGEPLRAAPLLISLHILLWCACSMKLLRKHLCDDSALPEP